ncbi:hypothetical protein AOLI_G00044100 [Acnodon oligacanthus]
MSELNSEEKEEEEEVEKWDASSSDLEKNLRITKSQDRARLKPARKGSALRMGGDDSGGDSSMRLTSRAQLDGLSKPEIISALLRTVMCDIQLRQGQQVRESRSKICLAFLSK